MPEYLPVAEDIKKLKTKHKKKLKDKADCPSASSPIGKVLKIYLLLVVHISHWVNSRMAYSVMLRISTRRIRLHLSLAGYAICELPARMWRSIISCDSGGDCGLAEGYAAIVRRDDPIV
jgi:hypothetical protein